MPPSRERLAEALRSVPGWRERAARHGVGSVLSVPSPGYSFAALPRLSKLPAMAPARGPGAALVSTQRPDLSLFEGLQRSGMTPAELWIRYYAVGGDAAELEVEAYALGLLSPDDYERNLIAQALNEFFSTATKITPCITASFPRWGRRAASRTVLPARPSLA